MNKSGISALIDVGAWFEDRLGGEVLSIGRPAEAEYDCSLEMLGTHLAYCIVLNGPFASVYAHSMDTAEQPQFLLTVKDDKTGWGLAATLIRKLETSGLKDLSQRPIELGNVDDDGRNSIVIE